MTNILYVDLYKKDMTNILYMYLHKGDTLVMEWDESFVSTLRFPKGIGLPKRVKKYDVIKDGNTYELIKDYEQKYRPNDSEILHILVNKGYLKEVTNE